MLSVIVAMDQQGLIGAHNRLPWHLPADLKHFRNLTWGKPIIMGRKTFESIGKPLPQRDNIVLTQNPHFVGQGCQAMADVTTVLTFTQHHPESFIIGGASVYQQFLPYAHRLYITWIHAQFKGDTYFPSFNMKHWQESARQDYKADIHNPYAYSFLIYQSLSV